MFETKSIIPDQIAKILDCINSATQQLDGLDPDFLPDTVSAKTLYKDEEKLRVAVSKFLDDYKDKGDWAVQGHLTAQSALMHETGSALRTIRAAMRSGYLCNEYEVVSDAIKDGHINWDHVQHFDSLLDSKYEEYLNDHIDMLVKNAKQLDAKHFGYVLKHWKNMVDALLDESTDTFKSFQGRHLYLSKTMNDIYVIQGELDAATGAILEKALNDIIDKIWRDEKADVRSGETHAQRRADAIGYLAQGYVTGETVACHPRHPERVQPGAKRLVEGSCQAAHEDSKTYTYKPSLHADVVIDLADVKRSENLNEFLQNCLDRETPIRHAHSKEFIEQILCDSSLSMPVKNEDGTHNLGRSVRTAPAKLKKQLALQHPTCFVKGCHVPHQWCDAHHVQHWVDGGETSLDNLVLLCRKHHTMTHNHAKLEFELPPLEDTG